MCTASDVVHIIVPVQQILETIRCQYKTFQSTSKSAYGANVVELIEANQSDITHTKCVEYLKFKVNC